MYQWERRVYVDTPESREFPQQHDIWAQRGKWDDHKRHGAPRPLFHPHCGITSPLISNNSAKIQNKMHTKNFISYGDLKMNRGSKGGKWVVLGQSMDSGWRCHKLLGIAKITRQRTIGENNQSLIAEAKDCSIHLFISKNNASTELQASIIPASYKT